MHVKPRLLVLQLWGLGDLVIATPFLRAAVKKYEVTMVGKPFAADLRPRLWPEIDVICFNAPWTVFRGKYHLWHWPWLEMLRLRRRLIDKHFDFGVSGRWDPRDHLVLKVSTATERLGFSRLQSRHFLTRELVRPQPLAHMSEYWRVAGRALGLEVPAYSEIVPPPRTNFSSALLHSGARLPARVWPLENFQQIAASLRKKNIAVQIACDPDQREWWSSHGENVACPQTVPEVLSLIDRAGIFIGNCSGPGHLAAICGVPTFTVFGPSMHEWWAPMHPAAEIFEGKACPYKPCADYCRYKKPFCLSDVKAGDVWPRVEIFAERHLTESRQEGDNLRN